MPMRAAVIEVFDVKGSIVVVCDLLEGEVSTQMVMNVEGANDSWCVVGIKVPTPEPGFVRRRGLIVKPVRSGRALKAGDILTAQ